MHPRPGGLGRCRHADSPAARPRSVFRHIDPALCGAGLGGRSSSQPSASWLPAELWVGKEGRAKSAAGPAHSSGWESVGRVLEAPCPSGAHRGLCLVRESRKLPTLGKSPPSLRVGLITTSSAEGHTQAGCLGSRWGGGSGYRAAGSSASASRSELRGHIVGMVAASLVWWHGGREQTEQSLWALTSLQIPASVG